MQYPENFLGQKIWKRSVLASMAQSDPDSPEAVAFRLMVLQEATSPGLSQTAFAAKIGIEVKRWNNYLRGSPLPREGAEVLVRRFPGISYEWLWHGKLDAVPMRLQAELEAAGKRITSAPVSRSRSG